eukprot:4447300-Pleurochrysis_carterae.AAC.2
MMIRNCDNISASTLLATHASPLHLFSVSSVFCLQSAYALLFISSFRPVCCHSLFGHCLPNPNRRLGEKIPSFRNLAPAYMHAFNSFVRSHMHALDTAPC